MLTYLIAFLAGGALPLGFAPFSFWPAVFISLGLLFWLISNKSPRQAARLGACFGFGYFGFGVHWIYHSLHLFGGAVAPLSALMTLVFVLVMVLFPLLTCWLFAKLRRSDALSVLSVAGFASIWVLSELLRGWIFGGFPWLLVGYSQVSSGLLGYAPVIGVYGITWIVLVIAGSLVVLVRSPKRLTRVGAALIIVGLSVGALGLNTLQWTTPKPTSLKIRLVQGNIPQEMKFSRERLESSIQTYASMSASAPAETQIIIWPETAIPTYFDRVEEALEPFSNSMTARGMDVLTGGFHRDEQDRVFNSFRQLGGDKALYSKRHLVPFGEFMPFRPLLGFISRFIVIPMSDISVPDGTPEPLLIQGEQLGISICYEDVFGEEMRDLLPASTVLVNVSNDAWFGDKLAPQQHQEMAQMRAREMGRPLVRVTNTGISSSINHKGEVTATIAHSTKGTLDVEVVPRVGTTPYVILGNSTVMIVAGLIVLLLLARRRRATGNLEYVK